MRSPDAATAEGGRPGRGYAAIRPGAYSGEDEDEEDGNEEGE